MRRSIAVFTLLPAALAVATGCASDSGLGGGVASVTGVVFGADSTPWAHVQVVGICHGPRARGSAVTDANGHYKMSISSMFPDANGYCIMYSPDSAHAVSRGTDLIFWQPLAQVHPEQVIDLVPITTF